MLHLGQRINSAMQRNVTFGITRHLANDEFVVVFRRTRRTEVDGCPRIETNNGHYDNRENEEDVLN